ncbi:MAG: UDP-glucose 4-epimerase GalE [Rikenellaceae bacterium]
MSTVLVAGGAGYIGSHTTVELINAGYEVVIVDNLNNSQISMVKAIETIVGKKVPFEQIDCCDKNGMTAIFEKYPIDAIIHFAAHKAVGESVSKPLEYYHNNLLSLINIMEIMRDKGVHNLVFSSSCTVYGQPEVLPVTEQTPGQKAMSPYGNTKQMSEEIIEFTTKAHDIHAIALRYFNPIGAHPSSLIGELPIGTPLNLIPYVTQTAAGLRECLSIYGSDYNTPDGTAVRDYIDVVDLAKAHVVAISRMLNGKSKSKYEIFNIGTGNGLSVLKIVKSFERVNNLKLNYKIVGRREGDIEKIWADASFANNELGWKASISTDETLRNAWAWEKHVRGIK